MNGDRYVAKVLSLMRDYGLISTYSNLLVVDTCRSSLAKNLYVALKLKGTNVDNRPDNLTRYDFIYSATTDTAFRLYSKLRGGGIMLVEDNDSNFELFQDILMPRVLKVNKRFRI